MKRSILKTLLTTSLLLTGVGNANAQSEWEHTLVPLYLWASGIEGTSQVGPIIAPVSIQFEDALDNLDTTLTVHYEANKGNIGFLADVYHIGLAPQSVLPNGAPVAIDLTNNIYEVGGIYRPETANGLELLYGLRGTSLKLEGAIGSTSKSTLIKQDWLDAFVGLRKNFSLSKNTSFTARGDIGTGDSDLVWNAALLLGYRFNKTVSMFGGYRWLDYDYETGSGPDRFTYDVTYEGPAIALRFDW